MTTRERFAPVRTIVVIALLAWTAHLASAQEVRRVILVIGDGMGIAPISYASQMQGSPLALESMPVTGLVRTQCSDRLITDSAAGASAMATGVRVPYNALSRRSDGAPLRTIAEACAQKGLGVGLVTSTFLFDATPGAFVAHSPTRYAFLGILEDGFAPSGASVLIGGDLGLIIGDAPRRARLDPQMRPRWERLPELFEKHGFRVELDTPVDAIDLAPDDRLLALYSVRPGRSPDVFGPRLRRSVRLALDRLDHEEGFFLLVESEEIDEGEHANDEGRVLDGMKELDGALRVLLDYARARDDTLVIVTADHACGGMSVIARREDGSPDVRWTTPGHTAEWVPVFAEGPGSERFAGVMDNTHIGRTIADLMGLEGVGDPLE